MCRKVCIVGFKVSSLFLLLQDCKHHAELPTKSLFTQTATYSTGAELHDHLQAQFFRMYTRQNTLDYFLDGV